MSVYYRLIVYDAGPILNRHWLNILWAGMSVSCIVIAMACEQEQLWVDIALCRFLYFEAISRHKESRSRDYALLLFIMTSWFFYSAQYHRQHYTFHVFEKFWALYMHSHDDKYPSQPGFEPGTSWLQAPVDTNELSGPAILLSVATTLHSCHIMSSKTLMTYLFSFMTNFLSSYFSSVIIRIISRFHPNETYSCKCQCAISLLCAISFH